MGLTYELPTRVQPKLPSLITVALPFASAVSFLDFRSTPPRRLISRHKHSVPVSVLCLFCLVLGVPVAPNYAFQLCCTFSDRRTKSAVMVGFKNRYLVMEVLLDPTKDQVEYEPVVITQLNLFNAIKESMLMNFGECGLASSLHSFQVKYVNPITKLCIIRTSREDYQRVWAAITLVRSIVNCSVIINLLDLSGNIKACKNAALKCDQLKFEQYKSTPRVQISDAVLQNMQNCIEKIKVLES
ncbi:OLC1v1020971C1 [Oldenlandia corymbosa var. corymbosa]|uniref:OLC1v1020971C1 n=1 Tax=Oldenlandia corymbosa var. corymbosa TaxID=529605 RepID=A0AAV1BVV5_OLDCO|nr:OLC1v1020971C1 [Oldenlandia corymbosa var. corymbosa]